MFKYGLSFSFESSPLFFCLVRIRPDSYGSRNITLMPVMEYQVFGLCLCSSNTSSLFRFDGNSGSAFAWLSFDLCSAWLMKLLGQTFESTALELLRLSQTKCSISGEEDGISETLLDST